jgi:AraC family transcriptional regulator
MTTLEKIQEPTFITKPAFTVVGLRIRTQPESPDIPKLWNQYVPRIDEVEHLAELDVSYGVMAGADDGMDYLAGNPVSKITELPAGMSRWDIPEATYAIFETTIPMMEKTFGNIFDVWLPASDYQQGSGPLLERYGETFSPDNPVVSVYIPVVKKP